MDRFEYQGLTGAQRLVRLYEILLSRRVINPSEYAREVGVARQTVYRQLDALSGARVDVLNVGRGEWTLLRFVGDKYDN